MTKEQWYPVLVGWLPDWWTAQTAEEEAILWGMAALLAELDATLDDHVKETFIAQAGNGFLDEHGFERNLTRFTGELNPPFSDRIRNITNTTNCPTIQDIVDALLDVGTAAVVEDFQSDAFYDRETFFNRGSLLLDEIYNAFSIVVDNQVHAPYSFYDREYFMDRENFMGTNESSFELFKLIVEAVNKAKALGTVYRLIERAS